MRPPKRIEKYFTSILKQDFDRIWFYHFLEVAINIPKSERTHFGLVSLTRRLMAARVPRWWPIPSGSLTSQLGYLKQHIKYGGFHKGGDPQKWLVYHNPTKTEDLGVPPSLETSIWSNINFINLNALQYPQNYCPRIGLSGSIWQPMFSTLSPLYESMLRILIILSCLGKNYGYGSESEHVNVAFHQY